MRRAPSVLVPLLITALMAGCQTGSEEPQNTNPTLVESEPADGATGPVEQIRLEFSEAMDETSLVLTLCTHFGAGSEPDCTELSGDFIVWNDDSTEATWDPHNTLQTATSYTLHVHVAALNGDVLETEVDFSIPEAVDDTPPEILESEVSVDMITGFLGLTLVFSEPMNRASVELAFTSNPLTECEWTWLGGPEPGQESGICLTSALEQHTDYLFVVTTSATDLAGNDLAVTFTRHLAVGNLAPRVTNIDPPDGGKFVGPKEDIRVTFNENAWIDEDTQWLVSTAAGSVSGTVSGSITHTLMFTPDGSYGDGALVTWELINVGDDNAPNMTTVTGSFTTRPVATPTGER